MNRNKINSKPFPGARLFLYLGGVLGLVRATAGTVEEERADKESIDPKTGSSHDDVDFKLVWRIGFSVLFGLWGTVVLVSLLFYFFQYDRTGGRNPGKVLAYLPTLPPRPRNVNHPYQYLNKYLEREGGELSGYQWVDRNKGVVSIPIGRAMQLVSERGIPPSPPPTNPNEYYPPSAGSLRTGFQGKVDQER